MATNGFRLVLPPFNHKSEKDLSDVIFFAQISISGKGCEISLQGIPAELRGPAEVVGTFKYTQSTFADQTYC